MIKTNKSYTKRLKMTKNGKLLARRPGQNHFNSKERNATRQAKKGLSAIVLKNKQKSTFLPNA